MRLGPRSLGTALVVLFGCGGSAVLAETPSGEQPGIFVTGAGGAAPIRLHGTLATQTHAKGVAGAMLKSMLTQGLAGGGSGVEFVLEGAAAEVRVKEASFLIRLQPQGQKAAGAPPDLSSFDMSSMLSGGFDMMPPQAKSGDEFVLARLTVADGARHLGTSQGNNGGLKTNAAVPVDFEHSGPNAVTAHARGALEPGEYAFYYGGPSGGGQFWTFGVDPR
jgi:hypothetical protein